MPERTKLSVKINNILGYISIVTMSVLLLSYSYIAGKDAHRIDNLEKRQSKSEQVDKELFERIDDVYKISNNADTKLGLLLNYFGIADSARYQ